MITVENNQKYTQYPKTIEALNKIENITTKSRQYNDLLSDDEFDFLGHHTLHIATALINDNEDKAVKIAKIILAAKGIGDIHIKIE